MVKVRESGDDGDYTSLRTAIDAEETGIDVDLPWVDDD